GVERHRPGTEETRHIREEDRDVVGPAFVHRRPGVRADEQGPVAEVARHGRREMGTRTLAVKVDDADVVQVGGALHERVEQDLWGRGGAVDIDLITAADAGDGLGWTDDLHRSSVADPARVGRWSEPPHRRSRPARDGFLAGPAGPPGGACRAPQSAANARNTASPIRSANASVSSPPKTRRK